MGKTLIRSFRLSTLNLQHSTDCYPQIASTLRPALRDCGGRADERRFSSDFWLLTSDLLLSGFQAGEYRSIAARRDSNAKGLPIKESTPPGRPVED